MVTNPTIATAFGKVMFMVKETGTRGNYNSAVYTGSNAVFLNTPAIPQQGLRKVNSRQQRPSYSKRSRVAVGYGKGTMEVDVPIKPSGALGTPPHGRQLLEGWWGEEVIDPGVSVTYQPLAPEVGEVYPSYTTLVKYGHEVFLLVGTVVEGGNINGVSDGSENVIAAFTGNLAFLRMYWVGKDEIGATEATGQTVITVKDAQKFAMGFSSSPAVGMKVGFRTVAGVVDDNSGAGYTLTAVDVGANTITINPALAGAGLAANDVVYGFVPEPVDSGVEVTFNVGGSERGEDTNEDPITLVGFNYVMNNPFIKILENEKSATGHPYPSRIVDAGGSATLREAYAELSYIENEDDTNIRYIADQQIEYTAKSYWGNVVAERFYIRVNQAELEAPEKSGDEEITTVTQYQAFGTDDEAVQVFD